LVSCAKKDTDQLVKIKTSKGEITVLLYEETPGHKRNFLQLASSGKYDSTLFHRVIEKFMIQGGDVYRKDQKTERESDRLDAEIVEGFMHHRGALAAARQGNHVNPEKKSSGCQFYIVQGKIWEEAELTTDQVRLNQALTEMFKSDDYDSLENEFLALQLEEKFDEMNALAMKYRDFVEKEMDMDLRLDIDEERLETYTTLGGVPHLDGEYTVFGRVVEGIDVIDKIAAVPTRNDKPIKDIHMTLEVIEVPRSEITKKYGYVYPD
jgi:peptidyl-prolyl cis-trans isomerase B (cyclophilin B)